MAKTDEMREKPKSTALWDTGGSSKQTEVEQGGKKKPVTNPGKPKPEPELYGSGTQEKIDGFEKRDSVSPSFQTRSPRR